MLWIKNFNAKPSKLSKPSKLTEAHHLSRSTSFKAAFTKSALFIIIK